MQLEKRQVIGRVNKVAMAFLEIQLDIDLRSVLMQISTKARTVSVWVTTGEMGSWEC